MTTEGPNPPTPTSVHIVRERTGFGRALVTMLLALCGLGAVFVTGLIVGVIFIGVIGFALGGSALDTVVLPQEYRSGGGNSIAILPVRGVIDARQAEIARLCVNEILDDRSVRAVVLRVDSPGGDVAASDRLWYQVERLRKSGRPVVASFGGMAASGGYYVACGADHIVAEETCITGSIGVIAQIMTLDGLAEKVGIEPVTLVARRSPEKDTANDIFRAWSERDREQVLGMLDAAYDIFFERVRLGRVSTVGEASKLRELADGSIFTAPQAKENGLVDAIGYLDDAITEAEKRAKLTADAATVTIWRERPTLLPSMPLVRRNSPAGLLDADRLRSLVNELGSVRLMYLRP